MAGAGDATSHHGAVHLVQSTMMTVVLKYLEDNIFEVRTVTTGYPVPAGLQISPVMMLMKLA